jgi:hypothetical protein
MPCRKFGKRVGCKQKSVAEGFCRDIYKRNVGNEGHSSTCKDKFNSKGEVKLVPDKTHVTNFQSGSSYMDSVNLAMEAN